MKTVKKKREKVVITLSGKDIATLSCLIRSGTTKARVITRARILLLSHHGRTNRSIMDALACSQGTITEVRKRYRDRTTIDAALHDAPRSGQPKKITAKHEAFVIATACTDAPLGHDHWTLNALKDKLLTTYHTLDSVSHERIRHILLEANLKPWREKNVVRPQAHG